MNNIYGCKGLSVFLACFVSIILQGCAGDEPSFGSPVASEAEVVEVPVSIILGNGWSVDVENSRAVPPSVDNGETALIGTDGEVETAGVDKVRILVFRRKAPAEGVVDVPDDGSDFYFDPTNYQEAVDVVSVKVNDEADNLGSGHHHRIAKGRLKKIYGYEYRVVALAYSSTAPTCFNGANSMLVSSKFPDNEGEKVFLHNEVGDQNRFELPIDKGTALSYKELYAEFPVYSLVGKGAGPLNSDGALWPFFTGAVGALIPTDDDKKFTLSITQVPQLFYAVCSTLNWDGEQCEIIRFSEQNQDGDAVKNLPLSGILYRGMAKVELHIRPVVRHTTEDLRNYTYTTTGFTLMADNVYTRTGLTDYDQFNTPSAPIDDNADPMKKKFTPLAHCIVGYGDSGYAQEEYVLTTYLLPGVTRLAVRIAEIRKGSHTQTNINTDAWLKAIDLNEAGDNGTGIVSPDAHNGFYYFRRNHKYVITVDDAGKLINSKNCQLTM